MAHINKEFVSFFRELGKNNNTEWFNANRKRYETHVKKPFASLVEDLIARIQKVDPSVKIKPADAITRINKDIRFSKDKTPYNTYVGAVISSAGKKDKSVPGLYLQLTHDKSLIFGGAYVLDPVQLKKVRSRIAADPAGFSILYKDRTFREHFKEIKGEQAKRLDAEWQKVANKEPMIANKQFYFNTELKASDMLSDDFVDTVVAHYKTALPLNRFLQQALTSKK